jgi:hypothetical protein
MGVAMTFLQEVRFGMFDARRQFFPAAGARVLHPVANASEPQEHSNHCMVLCTKVKPIRPDDGRLSMPVIFLLLIFIIYLTDISG